MQPRAKGKWNHSTSGMQRRMLAVSSGPWPRWSLSCREGLPEHEVSLTMRCSKAQSPALLHIFKAQHSHICEPPLHCKHKLDMNAFIARLPSVVPENNNSQALLPEITQ